MDLEREGRVPRLEPGKAPSRDRWSKAEIIAVVIGTVASVVVIPLVVWLVATLTDLQVQVGVVNARLNSIDKTLVSMDDRLKKLEDWQLEHLKGHPMVHVEGHETTTGE